MVKENKSQSSGYFAALRNFVVIELLFATGARVSEIANIKLHALNIDSGVLTIYGKGGKQRKIQICNQDTVNTLRTYCELLKKKINHCDGYLLINRLGKKLSDQSIRNLVVKLAINSKINNKVTPHMIRHTFATLLLDNNVDIKYIQSLLGHSSIVTTQIYTHVNLEKQKKILAAKHPRMHISLAL